MKIFKNLASALMVLPVLAALTACSDDEGKYTPAEALTNAQVYFSNELPDVVELSKDNSTFDVQVCRINTKGELVAPIVVEQDEANVYAIPTSVTFADGESTANLTIGYDPEALDYNEMHNVVLTIGDETYTTPYGDSSYAFQAGVVPPMTAWCSNPDEFEEAGGQGDFPLGKAGTGTYKYSLFWSGDDPDLPVFYRQNTVDPNLGQFMIKNVMYGIEFIIDSEWDEELGLYRLYVPETFTGYVHPSYGNVYAGDYIVYYAKRGWGDLTWDVLYKNNVASNYDPVLGKFTFYLYYYVSAGYFGNGPETFQVKGFYIYDYSATAVYAGLLKTPAEEYQGVVDFTFGVDVASAKYAITEASVTEEDAAAAIAAGELEAEEITESGRVYLPLEEEGNYRVTVVTYGEDGEAKESASCTFEFEKGGSSWESLGECLYTDDFMTMGYYDEETEEWVPVYNGLEPQTYAVELLSSTKKPGLYRLKNAYGEVYPFNEEGDWDASMDYYLEIDATDPENVFIKEQELGLDWGNGMISIVSDAAYYMNLWECSAQEVIETFAYYGLGSPFGTLANGAITFPEDVFTVMFGENSLYGNHNGAFKVALPEASSASAIKAAKFARRLRGGKARFNGTVKGAKRYHKVIFKMNLKNDKPATLK